MFTCRLRKAYDIIKSDTLLLFFIYLVLNSCQIDHKIYTMPERPTSLEISCITILLTDVNVNYRGPKIISETSRAFIKSVQ